MDCLFCKIVNGDIPANIIHQDEQVIAFDDISPQAPVHKLIIPRQHFTSLNDLTEQDAQVIGHMTHVAKSIAMELNIAESGYRLVMNCNDDGGQTVGHIHMHLLGGRAMTWPPG